MTQKLDLRIQKTYLALTSTFLKMLEEMPFEDLTVNELCSRAMVRRATFYKHFADKYEFFTFVVKETQQSFLERSAQNAGQPQHFYYNTIASVFDFIDENRMLVASARKSRMFPMLLNVVSEQTARDVKEQLEQEERAGKKLPASPVILAQMFTGALINISRWWLLENEKMPKEQMAEQTAALLLPLLTKPDAPAALNADTMTTRRVYQNLRERENLRFTAQLDAYVSGKLAHKMSENK